MPGSQGLDLRRHRAGAPLKGAYTRGFAYSDGWVDDARLVVLNAIDAREHGATVLTRTLCGAPQRHAQHWSATLTGPDGRQTEVTARCLVNASGPWAERFLGAAASAPLRLVKGSHIVVRRLFEHPYAYIFQHPDGRIVFAIPYERDFTLIGTTDLDFQGDLDRVAIDADEIDYLCRLSNRYFARQIGPRDVVWNYSGVRPLVEDAAGNAAAATRDFRLEHDTEGAPLLTVLGGKITTFRKLAEQAVDWIAPLLGKPAAGWTGDACLPGGDLFGERPSNRGVLEFEQWAAALQVRYAWLPAALVARYARAYGTRIDTMLAQCKGMADMGGEIVPDLYRVEVQYLIKHEWALSADDILWRRSKLGLHLPAGSAEILDAWLAASRDAGHAASA